MKKSPAEILAIHQEMKKELRSRECGDLKGKDTSTKTVIRDIKRKYLDKAEKDKIAKELANIQKIIRSRSGGPNPILFPRMAKMWPQTWSMKDNSEFVTEHLKLTCRVVMDKYPLT